MSLCVCVCRQFFSIDLMSVFFSILSCRLTLFKLPLLPAHGALLLHLLRVQPLQDAVHVEAVWALTPDQWAVISRNFTVWTAAIKRSSADAAVLIVGHPEPWCHTVPLLYLHLHIDWFVELQRCSSSIPHFESFRKVSFGACSLMPMNTSLPLPGGRKDEKNTIQ